MSAGKDWVMIGAFTLAIVMMVWGGAIGLTVEPIALFPAGFFAGLAYAIGVDFHLRDRRKP